MGPWLEELSLGGHWHANIANDDNDSWCWPRAEGARRLGPCLSTRWGQGSLPRGDTGAQLLAWGWCGCKEKGPPHGKTRSRKSGSGLDVGEIRGTLLKVKSRAFLGGLESHQDPWSPYQCLLCSSPLRSAFFLPMTPQGPALSLDAPCPHQCVPSAVSVQVPTPGILTGPT